MGNIRPRSAWLFAFASAIAAAILWPQWPAFTNHVIFHGNASVLSDVAVPPSDYLNLSKIASGRLLILPFNYWGEASYRWPSGIHPNADTLLEYFGNIEPIQFLTGSPNADELVMQAARCLQSCSYERLRGFLFENGFSGILLHLDYTAIGAIKSASLPENEALLKGMELKWPTSKQDYGSTPQFAKITEPSMRLEIQLVFKQELDWQSLNKNSKVAYPLLLSSAGAHRTCITLPRPCDAPSIALSLDRASRALNFGVKTGMTWHTLAFPVSSVLLTKGVYINALYDAKSGIIHLAVNGVDAGNAVCKCGVLPQQSGDIVIGGPNVGAHGSYGYLRIDSNYHALIERGVFYPRIRPKNTPFWGSSLAVMRLLQRPMIGAEPFERHNQNVRFERRSPDTYRIQVGHRFAGTLYFLEAYSSLWKVKGPATTAAIHHQKYLHWANAWSGSFEPGIYELHYDGNRYIWLGIATSLFALVALMALTLNAAREANDS